MRQRRLPSVHAPKRYTTLARACIFSGTRHHSREPYHYCYHRGSTHCEHCRWRNRKLGLKSEIRVPHGGSSHSRLAARLCIRTALNLIDSAAQLVDSATDGALTETRQMSSLSGLIDALRRAGALIHADEICVTVCTPRSQLAERAHEEYTDTRGRQ